MTARRQIRPEARLKKAYLKTRLSRPPTRTTRFSIMAAIFIGDVQGCCSALERLLDKVRFDQTLARVILVGGLVNRGPNSAAVLQLLLSLGTAASTVLGNHDIHLLAVAAGAREQRPDDTFLDILKHPARESMIA